VLYGPFYLGLAFLLAWGEPAPTLVVTNTIGKPPPPPNPYLIMNNHPFFWT